MNERPRYATLGDYLRVVKRRRLLIAAITLGCFVAALSISLTQSSVYVASAQLQFRDPLADLNLVGLGGESIPELAPNQRSAANAELVTRPEVTRQVAQKLDTKVSPDGLRGSVDARVSPQTNLVILEASWGDAEFAADLANAYAAAAKEVGTEEARQRLDDAEASVRAQVTEAREDLPASTFRLGVLEQNLAQVRSLVDIVEPVQIAERAEVPGAPASPQPVRNSILGLSIGLILGLLAAFVRDSLDRRLHSAQEVHDELDLPVLGRVGESAFSYAGLARNGAAPILESEFEAFRMLRMNLSFLAGGRQLRSILVTSALAEEGKSTVSMALASAAALAGQRVLLVESDLRKPSFSRRLGIAREPGLTNYLVGSASPSEILQVVELTKPLLVTSANSPPRADPGTNVSMVCIAAGSPVPTAPELLQSERFRDFLGKVSKAYDLVILDGSPLLAVSDPLQIVPMVDGVLVCVRAQQTTREQARATRAALDHLPQRPAGAVLTGLRRGDEGYEYYYGY